MDKTDLGGFASGTAHGTSPFTTPAFTPPAGSLLVVRVARWRTYGAGAADIGEVSITDDLAAHLTYTLEDRVWLTADAPSSASFYSAEVGASEEMTITVVDATGESMGSWHVHLWAFEGYDTAGPVAGHTNSSTTNIGSDGDTRVLTVAPTADDYVLSGLQLDCDGTVSDPSYAAFVESYETCAGAGYGVVCSSWRTGSTDANCVITDVYTSGSTFYKASAQALIVKANPVPPQELRPIADVAAGGWSPTPLWSRLDETTPGGDGDVVTATAS